MVWVGIYSRCFSVLWHTLCDSFRDAFRVFPTRFIPFKEMYDAGVSQTGTRA